MIGLNEIKIREMIIKKVSPIKINTTLKDILTFILLYKVYSIPVVNETNEVIGIVYKNEILKLIKENNDLSVKIMDVIDKDYQNITVSDNENFEVVFNKKANELFVLDDDNKFIGIVSKSDYIEKNMDFILQSFNSLINSVNHGVLALDNETRVVIINNIAEKTLGIKKENAIGKKINDVFSETELPSVIKTGKSKINELILLKGRKILTNRTPIIKDGNIIGAIALFQDVTEHDNLLKELEEQKNIAQVLNTILETAYDGILVVDKKGYITMISKTYAKFLGVQTKEVIGKHVTEVIQNTRMHKVAKAGVAEIAHMQQIKGNYMIASRIPIVKNGEVVGAVGKVLFRKIDDLNDMYKKINLMEKELEQYKGELNQINKAKYTFESIIGTSKEIKKTKELGKKAAQTDSNVLIIGESGTGKELFAHAIHNDSSRNFGPFIRVNCAAIPKELLEAELFGYEEGAFTGAKKGGKIGKFELANGGTIFLDEIGDMPLNMQSKLLRVIQEREIERVGSSVCKRINVRIIAATNRDLENMVKEGEYRQDLYFRLNVFNLLIPPLRERIDDISLLCKYFLYELSNKYHKKIDGISKEAMNCLINYEWSGNVRELANIIERGVNIIDREDIIKLEHLPKKIIKDEYVSDIKTLKEILNTAEKEAIIKSLKITDGNKSKAAKLLGIGRTTFYEKLDKFNSEINLNIL